MTILKLVGMVVFTEVSQGSNCLKIGNDLYHKVSHSEQSRISLHGENLREFETTRDHF